MLIVDNRYMEIVEAYKNGGYTNRDMISFMPGHKRSRKICVVGLCPSKATKPTKTGSFAVSKYWFNEAGIFEYDLCNIVPHIENVPTNRIKKEIYYDLLKARVSSFPKVIALGNHASDALDRINIPHLKIPHPSRRNILLNNPKNVEKAIADIRKYYHDN